LLGRSLAGRVRPRVGQKKDIPHSKKEINMFLTESIEAGEQGAGRAGSLAEILVEAEVSYGNLVRRMMTLEHKAIITEDAQLLAESVGGFWETFKAWLKKWVTKVKNFFLNLWTSISGVFMKDKAWIKGIRDKKLAFGKVEGIKVHKGVASGKLGNGLSKVETFAAGIEKNEVTGEEGVHDALRKALCAALGDAGAESVYDAMVKNILGSEEAEEADVADSGAFLNHLEALIGATEKSKNETLKAIDMAAKAAEKKANEKGTDPKVAEKLRSGLSLVSSALSAYSSAIGKARSEMRSIISAGVTAGRKATAKDVHGESALFEGVI